MSPSHRNAQWHFPGRAAKPAETPQGIAPRLTSRKHRARLTSQTKTVMFISGEHWQPRHVTKGRVCKTVPLPLNPSHFLDRKKKEVLSCMLWLFFLVTNSLQTLACYPPCCCLPEGHAGLAGNISSSPDPQDVSSQWPQRHPWCCPLSSAGFWGRCSGYNGTVFFRSTMCLDVGRRLGS